MNEPENISKNRKDSASKDEQLDLVFQSTGSKNKEVPERLLEESTVTKANQVKSEQVDRRSWRIFARVMTADTLPTPLPVNEDKFFNLLIGEIPDEEGADLFMGGATALKEGRKGEATIAFERLMKYFPDSILLERIAFLKGLTILRDSSFYPEKGMRYLEGAARRYPDSAFAPSALLVVAQEYTKLKFYPEAMGLYRRIISQYPDSPYEAKILLGKAKIYKTRKMFRRAEVQLKEALRQATDDDDKAMATFPYGRVL